MLAIDQHPAAAQGVAQPNPDHIFTVSNYPVEARAADAVAAKAKAMAEGERAAFRSLLRRLVPVTAYARIRRLNPPRIAALLDGVSVRSERNSSTDYVANIDFSFNAKAIRDLLEREGLPFADQQARPILVVPVWQAAGAGPQAVPDVMTAQLGPATWTNAWKSLDLVHTLTPVKLETLKPELAVDAVKAFAGGNLAFFSKLTAAYGVERLIIAFAEPDLGAKRLNVTLVGQDSRGAIHWLRGYRIDLGDPAYTIEAAAVISLGVLEGRWKGAVSRGGRFDLAAPAAREPQGSGWSGTVTPTAQQPTGDTPTSVPQSPPPAGGARQTLNVEFRGMGEWTEISRKLSVTAGLADLDVVGMNQRGARVTASVTGTFDDLKASLASQGLQLRAANGQWLVSGP